MFDMVNFNVILAWIGYPTILRSLVVILRHYLNNSHRTPLLCDREQLAVSRQGLFLIFAI